MATKLDLNGTELDPTDTGNRDHYIARTLIVSVLEGEALNQMLKILARRIEYSIRARIIGPCARALELPPIPY